MVRSIVTNSKIDYQKLIEIIPSNPIPNALFSNKGDLNFSYKSNQWGLDKPTFSSGAVWADLNNNGALDLIINDINNPARIYRNNIHNTYSDRNSLFITLKGEKPNTFAIGATVEVWSDDKYWFREHYLQRGYQSSVQPGIHIGIGEVQIIDSVKVNWPNGSVSTLMNIELPTELVVNQIETQNSNSFPNSIKPASLSSEYN